MLQGCEVKLMIDKKIWHYAIAAIFLTTIAAIGALWGQSMVRQVVRASGKTSIIIFVLAICIAFSAVVLGEFLQQLLKHVHLGKPLSSSLCLQPA
jgi:hypothetical protein